MPRDKPNHEHKITPDQITKLRSVLGKTMAGLARLFSIAPETWRKWENGECRPQRVHLKRLRELYKFTFGKLPEEGEHGDKNTDT